MSMEGLHFTDQRLAKRRNRTLSALLLFSQTHPCERCICVSPPSPASTACLDMIATSPSPPPTRQINPQRKRSKWLRASSAAPVRLLMSFAYVILCVVTIIGLLPSYGSSDENHKHEPLLSSLDDIEQLSYFVLRHYGYSEQDLGPDQFTGDDFHTFIDNLRHGILYRDPNFRHQSTNEIGSTNSDENDTHERTSGEEHRHKRHVVSRQVPSSGSKSSTNQQHLKHLVAGRASFKCDGVEWQPDRWGVESPERREKIEQLCNISQACQTSEQLVALVSDQHHSASGPVSSRIPLSKSIARLCPIMLYQLHDDTCTVAREQNIRQRSRPSLGSVWGFGLLFVTIISFCSLVGVSFMPLLTRATYETSLTMLTGLAVGSLLGSAIFHLIPQAFSLVGEDSEHGYLWKALIIFGGIYLFYWSERIMKIVAEERRRRKQGRLQALSDPTESEEAGRLTGQVPGNDKHVTFVNVKETSSTSNGLALIKNGHDHEDPKRLEPISPATETTETTELREREGSNESCQSSFLGSLRSDSFSKTHEKRSGRGHEHGHSHESRTAGPSTSCGGAASGSHVHHGHVHMEGDTPIATVAWMIIFGDGLHNFIDGLSIGAAFSESILAGISISVAVICEEFPHELGDFAILISSGMSLRQALGYNFLSACTCYIGLGFGILIGDFAEGSSLIFALAGGMFLYISLVDMMGELSATLESTAAQGGLAATIRVLILQNIGMLLGIATMFLLARYSEHINFEGLAPPENHLSADKPLIQPGTNHRA